MSQIIENIIAGIDYERGSIEKEENRHINSETIQDEEITISRKHYQAQHITTTTDIGKYRRQKIPFPTK